VRKIAIDHSTYNMTPPKVGTPGKDIRVTQQVERRKERMTEPENFVELEDVTTSTKKSIIPTNIEEGNIDDCTSQMGQSSKNPNGSKP
jgi:hypothetical protein